MTILVQVLIMKGNLKHLRQCHNVNGVRRRKRRVFVSIVLDVVVQNIGRGVVNVEIKNSRETRQGCVKGT